MKNYKFAFNSGKGIDESVDKAFDDMVDSGNLPEEIYLKPVFGEADADGKRIAVWYSKPDGQWVLDILYPNGTTGRLTGKTRREIMLNLLQARGEMEIENQNIICENERIERGIPEGFGDFEGEDGRQTAKWLREYLHGHEYAETMKYVTPAETKQMFRMVMGNLGKMKLALDNLAGASNLERAYCDLLDNNDTFWGFRVRALEEKQRQEDEQAAQQAAIEAELRKDRTPEVASPYANNKSVPNAAEIKIQQNALDARTMNLQELRRKAIPKLSGQKVNLVPIVANPKAR
jgi:hypothetical protein